MPHTGTSRFFQFLAGACGRKHEAAGRLPLSLIAGSASDVCAAIEGECAIRDEARAIPERLDGEVRRTAPGSKFPIDHHHTGIECNLVTRGTGVCTINGQTYDLKPGTLFWISSGQHHRLNRSPRLEMWVIQARNGLLPPECLEETARHPRLRSAGRRIDRARPAAGAGRSGFGRSARLQCGHPLCPHARLARQHRCRPGQCPQHAPGRLARITAHARKWRRHVAGRAGVGRGRRRTLSQPAPD